MAVPSPVPSYQSIIADLPIMLATSANATSGETLTFASSPGAAGFVDGAMVQDLTTPGAIAFGTTVTGTTSTTLTLSAAVASEVFSADSIRAFAIPIVIKATSGYLYSIAITTASPDAAITAFDNASAVTGTTIPPNSSAGAALGDGTTLNFGQAFANGLTLLLSGAVSATVCYG